MEYYRHNSYLGLQCLQDVGDAEVWRLRPRNELGGTMQDLIDRLNAAQESISQLLERL